jgi:hypothetical protein
LVHLLVVVCSGLAGVSDYNLPVWVDVADYGCAFVVCHGAQDGSTYRSIFDLPNALEFSAVKVHLIPLRSLALGILPLALGSGVEAEQVAARWLAVAGTNSVMLYTRL